MSIRVMVAMIDRNRVSDDVIPYQKIVSWDRRNEFPMLAYVDPVGITVFSRNQSVAIAQELNRILALVDETGIDSTIDFLGTNLVPEARRISQEWDPRVHLVPLVHKVLELCELVEAHPHQFLWFLGD